MGDERHHFVKGRVTARSLDKCIVKGQGLRNVVLGEAVGIAALGQAIPLLLGGRNAGTGDGNKERHIGGARGRQRRNPATLIDGPQANLVGHNLGVRLQHVERGKRLARAVKAALVLPVAG